MPTISIRGIEMPASPIRKLAPLADAAKQRGVHVFHLNIGQPDLPTPQAAIDAIRNIDRKVLEYSPSAGYRSYREKLTHYYKKFNINLTADDIIVTTGGSEAVLFAFLSCLNPGDEIIVPEPAYANYMAFAISAGAKIRTVATTIEEGFSLPKVEKFEELINERTKGILICNPNNPTGYLYTRREMNQIRDLVKKESVLRGLSVVLSTWAFWVILIYFAVPSLPGWATKNWLPTLFAENLGLDMAEAGPMSTITIAASSFVGVLLGGVMSDKWVLRNIRGRIYTSAIGLGMTIPALILLGFGHSVVAVVGAGMLFGIGFGMFDANNMPILCQIISAKYRATAYGIMNMVGVFAGAAVTHLLGKWTDGGNLGMGFAVLGGIVIVALVLQLACLRPTSDNVE